MSLEQWFDYNYFHTASAIYKSGFGHFKLVIWAQIHERGQVLFSIIVDNFKLCNCHTAIHSSELSILVHTKMQENSWASQNGIHRSQPAEQRAA